MKRASLRSYGLAALLVVGAAMAACGTDTTDVFGSGEQGSGASGGSGQGGAGQGGAGQGGTAGAGGAGQGGAGQGGAGQGGQGGAGQGGAGQSSSSSSSGPPPPVMISCGDTMCPIGGEAACCWDEYGQNGDPQGECVSGPPDADNCTTDFSGKETRIECQLPDNCPAGMVCCADINTGGGNWYSNVRCTDTCPYPGEITVCDPAAPNCPVVQTGGGMVQTVCEQSGILPTGYFICRTP